MKTKKEILELSKPEIYNMLVSKHAHYYRIMERYRELKASLIVLKKQLTNITDNIYIGEDFDKANSRVSYHKGGNANKKKINTLQQSRMDRHK